MGFSVKLLIILLDISVSASVVQSVNVTCTPQTICALRESKVELMCSYSHINTTTVFWFSPKQKAKWRNEEHPEDLALDSDYAGRVSYTETTRSSSTLTITDLRERDSGEYHLMLFTNTGEKYHSSTAVNLTVTDLQVKVSPTPRSEGQTVTLGCSTICTLPNNPTYIWYKNRQPVTNKPTKHNKLYLELAEGEGGLQYSCALGGPEESTVSKHVTVGVAVCLALILITGALWMWKRNYSSATDHRSSGESGQQVFSGPVYDDVSALTMAFDPKRKTSSGAQYDVDYSSVYFPRSHTQKASPCTTSRLPPHTSEDSVPYATVNFSRHTAASQ
uniref:Ig-like domain-containing protein n=1 Tax=Electrophorus electricus TaxID=8005 RepID=A0AAY5EL07_ELEEL